MFMDNIKNRVELRLDELTMTKADLCRDLGIEPQKLNNWLKRNSVPVGYIFKMAEHLECDPAWLHDGSVSGVGEDQAKYNANTEPAHVQNYGQVPLISWVQAGETHVALIDESEDFKMIDCYVRHSKLTYALEVRGDSMTSASGEYSFPEGTIILVDPEQGQDLTNGIFVIAKENGADAVTFKQLKYDGGTPYLNPLNSDYPKIFKEFRVLGKIIEAKMKAMP